MEELSNICNKCNTLKELKEFSRDKYSKNGYRKYCKQCNNNATKIWYLNNPIKSKESSRKSKLKRKKKVLEHYGNKCVCCGEDKYQFLTIDHINNDGAKHRKDNKTDSGSKFYLWILKNNFPTFLQILCWNCNAAKAYFGICPHQEK